ncbi:enkurin isoform X3 [Denticeps clupeoides]|uniref:enkurin isoform X3 n=1 Tax=Denticeps clupeoides TaxID=299321 RepID=UPI0010A58FA8|nr:enkurin isoform X3 [Denticeps clupeoides]
MSSTVCPPESIYNLIPREEVKDDKPPRYMSKFREQTKLERQANKAASRTMGPAKVEAPAPEKFLLKHSKEPRLPDKKPFSYPDNTARKAPLPVNTDPAGAGSSARKDFVKTNAMETIAATARRPQPVYADTKTGHKNLLENSGLVPKYLKKKVREKRMAREMAFKTDAWLLQDFGQTPDYILQRREEARRAQQQFDRYVAEHVEQGSMKQLSREEKDAILQGLKQKWAELNHQYQGLSVVTDTAPKKNRKERLEQEMKQLEKDIAVMERHKTIYISSS